MKMRITQPLRNEHRELLPRVEAVKEAADSSDRVSQKELEKKIEKVYEFLTRHLLPHAVAEEKALYPVVGKVMGSGQATRTMSYDHREIGRLVRELGARRKNLSSPVPLRRVLYGLYALVKVHFAKEEKVYLPILDRRLKPQEAREMFKKMEVAAKRAKGKVR